RPASGRHHHAAEPDALHVTPGRKPPPPQRSAELIVDLALLTQCRRSVCRGAGSLHEPGVPHPSALCALRWDSTNASVLRFSIDKARPPTLDHHMTGHHILSELPIWTSPYPTLYTALSTPNPMRTLDRTRLQPLMEREQKKFIADRPKSAALFERAR